MFTIWYFNCYLNEEIFHIQTFLQLSKDVYDCSFIEQRIMML